MYEIYMVSNMINGKKYIGQTSIGYLNRYSQHLKESKNKNADTYNTVFKKALRKYGEENFKIDLIDICETKEEANELEIYYIEYLNTYIGFEKSEGYNSTLGGDGETPHTRKEVYRIDYNGTILETISGVNNAEYKYGRGVCDCCNKKGGAITACGYVWYYKDNYDKMSLQEIYDDICLRLHKIVRYDKKGNMIDVWNSLAEVEETLGLQESNLSKAINGERRLCGDYIWTTYKDYIYYRETEQKPTLKGKITRAKPIEQYDLNGNYIRDFNSITEALLSLGKKINDSHISQVCKGQRKNAYGYIWKYK